MAIMTFEREHSERDRQIVCFPSDWYVVLFDELVEPKREWLEVLEQRVGIEVVLLAVCELCDRVLPSDARAELQHVSARSSA